MGSEAGQQTVIGGSAATSIGLHSAQLTVHLLVSAA